MGVLLRLVAAVAVFGAGAPPADAPPEPFPMGQPVEAVVVREKGVEIDLFDRNGPVLLVVFESPAPAACDTRPERYGLDAAIALRGAVRKGGGGPWPVLDDETATALHLPETAAEGVVAHAVFFDSRRALRIVQPLRSLTPEAVSAPVKRWAEGREIYMALCNRCHGADGTDMTYPEIKTLARIGERMTLDEIIAATEATGVVNLEYHSAEEKEALALFVAGL